MKTFSRKCRKTLAIVWFSGAGIIFLLVLVQTLFGKYSGQEQKAWEWFLPTVMPTLFLMVAVFVADVRQKQIADDETGDAFMFRLPLILSVVYFGVVLITLLVQPFTAQTIIEILDLSNLWLGPFQGLVTASLGAFFIKK